MAGFLGGGGLVWLTSVIKERQKVRGLLAGVAPTLAGPRGV